MRRRHYDHREGDGKPGSAEDPIDLPAGVELIGTLRGHTNEIASIAWSPDGTLIATPSWDGTVRIWDSRSLRPVYVITQRTADVRIAAFDRSSQKLATASDDDTVKLWEVGSWKSLGLRRLGQCRTLAFSPRENSLLTGGVDGAVLLDGASYEHPVDLTRGTVYNGTFNQDGDLFALSHFDGQAVWDAKERRLLDMRANAGGGGSMAFVPMTSLLATCTADDAIEIWDYRANTVVARMEGHTGNIDGISASPDGRLLASNAADETIRLWDCSTWSQVALISEPDQGRLTKGIAFHPSLPLLATVGADQGSPASHLVHIWRLDIDRLLATPRRASVAYKSAKIVLVGESGVGKTGLGYRLATDTFKDHASTHGQQFWLLDVLGNKRADEPVCEAILWDLAGQPDYRIIHTLFIDDADVALIVFDPTSNDDPLHGVDFWLSQLAATGPRTTWGIDRQVLLVTARADRGTGRLTSAEISRFCAERGIGTHVVTSARTGEGVEELLRLMRASMRWDERPPTITTETFQRIKATVLRFKEESSDGKVILSPAQLRDQLEHEDQETNFTDAEILTAVGHLANHGYVAFLKTSRGESRILLAPDLLNNIAASMVTEARRNPRGLGSLAEQAVLEGGYGFPELDGLPPADREVLLDSAIAMFLAHNVCFRETDPLTSRVYLVFPELINLRRPTVKNPEPTDEGTAYTVTGAIENVYASLVVLLGFTDVFTRTNQWRSQAEYGVGDGLICGFKLEAERDAELDFVLYFGANVGGPIRMLFQSLFESFLVGRSLTVHRYEPVICRNGHQLNRVVVREQLAAGSEQAFCVRCGDRIALPRADVPAELTRTEAADLIAERRTVDQRAQFEQALFRLKTYAVRAEAPELTCFISYAWGNPAQERWVERELATDLAKAGLTVLLDRWENARIGASVHRFVERAGSADRVIVVGTPLYRTKYDNDEPMGGFVVAAEGHLIATRMLGAESRKETVLPILLEGTQETALPLLLQGRVFGDFRQPEQYFTAALEVILSLHGIPPRDPVSIELRQSLDPPPR